MAITKEEVLERIRKAMELAKSKYIKYPNKLEEYWLEEDTQKIHYAYYEDTLATTIEVTCLSDDADVKSLAVRIANCVNDDFEPLPDGSTINLMN